MLRGKFFTSFTRDADGSNYGTRFFTRHRAGGHRGNTFFIPSEKCSHVDQ